MDLGLFKAVRDCRFKQLKFLVDSGLSVNQKNEEDQNTLVAAMKIENKTKRLNMFKYLLCHRANAHAYDSKTERNVFTWACFLNRTQEAKILLAHTLDEINMHSKDVYGRTALHYSVLRGNSELVTAICKHMAKYELTVDVRDNDGFTPFLLAKRLGFDDSVDILINVGMASPYQFDKTERKMGHDWQSEGLKEHIVNLKKSNAKYIAMYKTLGRLPSLRRASFNSALVDMVESKKDKRFLARADPSESLLHHKSIEDFSRVASRNPKRSLSLEDLTQLGGDYDEDEEYDNFEELPLTTRSEIIGDTQEHNTSQLRQRSLSSMSVASTDEALRWINLTTPVAGLDDAITPRSEDNSALSTQRSSSVVKETIPEMMTILEQQCSASFRQRVKPRPPGELVQESPNVPSNKSTMAIIFGRDGSKKVIKKEAKPQALQDRRNKRLAVIKEVT